MSRPRSEGTLTYEQLRGPRIVAFLEATADLDQEAEQFPARANPLAQPRAEWGDVLVRPCDAVGRVHRASCGRRGGRGVDGGADGDPAGSGNQDHGVVAEVFPVIGRTPPIRQPPIRRLSWRFVASLQPPSIEDHLDARVLQELTANPRKEIGRAHV